MRPPHLSALFLTATLSLGACSAGDSTPTTTVRAFLPSPSTQLAAVTTPNGFTLHPTPDLRADLGSTAAAPFRIVASPGGAVTVHRRGALPAAGHLDAGAIVYSGSQPNTDALVYATRAGVEELVVARAPGTTVAYDLDLPASYRLHRGAVPGLVEIRDATAAARLRLWVKRAWDAGGRDIPVEPIVEAPGRVRVALDETQVGAWPVVIDPEWTLATDMTIPRTQHTATLLPDGRVLIAGGDTPRLGLTEIFDPRTGTFTSAAPMTEPRTCHTATLLPSGKVLITGGTSSWSKRLEPLNPEDVTDTTEVFDPGKGTFTPADPLLRPRSHHTATLLPGGKVLLAGGFDGTKEPKGNAEVYDGNALTRGEKLIPLVGTRVNHAATLVDSGLVVLAGGGAYSQTVNLPGASNTIEVVDPGQMASVWSGSLPFTSQGTTGLLLPSGKVYLDDLAAFFFDPASASGQNATPFTSLKRPGESWGSVVLLPSGRVLIMGGKTDGDTEVGPTTDAVTLLDPAHFAYRSLPPMTTPRELATATLLPSGLVLIAGGYNRTTGDILASAEVYDPGEARLESAGEMLEKRQRHTMNLLSSGEVLIVGGDKEGSFADAEVYDPKTEVFHAVGPMIRKRASHTATTLPPPRKGASSPILIAGGRDLTNNGVNDVERYDPTTEWFFAEKPLLFRRQSHGAALLPDQTILFAGDEVTAELRSPEGGSQIAGKETTSRYGATSTLLDDGRVLLLGGQEANSGPVLHTASLFDGKGQVGSLDIGPPRSGHTATTLGDGSVLIMGGYSTAPGGMVPRDDVLRFYPAPGDQGSFVSQPKLLTPRQGHTATMLDNEHTLLVAGSGHSAELYDTANGTNNLLASTLPEDIENQVALRLLDGRVLLTGGHTTNGPSVSAVLYDHKDQAFHLPTESARSWHTATLLRSGNILFAGGIPSDKGDVIDDVGLATADLWSPHTRRFTDAGTMTEPRLGHTATLIAGDQVLIAGGLPSTNPDLPLPASQTFEIWNGTTFEKGQKLEAQRAFHTATLLPDGRVLLTGGLEWYDLLASAEIFDPTNGKSTATGSMHQARYRHAAVRLPSGRVLIAGGITFDKVHPLNGKPIATIEIYDPLKGEFEEVSTGMAPIQGDAHATMLPSGEALIVGNEIAYRFDENSEELSVAGAAPTHAFGAAVLPGGRLLVCGLDRCDTGTEAGPAFASVLNGVGRRGHSFTPLPSGELFALGLTPYNTRQTFSFRAFPPGARRPSIDHALDTMTAGDPTEVTGKRFQRMSARGTPISRPPLPHILPQVSFIPAAGGPPVTATPTAWSDTAITFTAPHTPYHGDGWLVVVVDGVPSEGTWIKLLPAIQGSACALDGECDSKHCAEGVCCDHSCTEGCRSCRAGSATGATGDGICLPIVFDEAPRLGCENTGDICSSNGKCDGRGDCIYPHAGARCGDSESGVCTKGFCLAPCTSNADCDPSLVCFPDGQCKPPADPGPAPSGCSASPGTDGTGALALAMLMLAARRRRAQKS